MFFLICLCIALLLYFYIRLNDAKIMHLPHDVASAFSPQRISARDALEAAAARREKPTPEPKTFLPPRTGRRYVVIGGVRIMPLGNVCQSVATANLVIIDFG
jgi:hypothetical protein